MFKKITYLSSLALALAYTSFAHSQTAQQQEYNKFASGDRAEIVFENGKRLPYTVLSRSSKGRIETILAHIHDPKLADLANYQNLIVTLDKDKQELQGFAETSDGHFKIAKNAAGKLVWQKISTPKVLDSILKPKQPLSTKSVRELANITANAEGEKDAAGNYVIDVFMGFSEQAAAAAGNMEAYAQMQVATVNTALKNSNIQGVYLRLVGVGKVPHNPGVVTSVLDDVKVWFKDDIERLAPDLIAMQQMPTGAPNEAAGWAGVGGASDTQVVGIPWPNAWRHEVGHNVGGLHCKEAGDTGYHYGFSVRPGRGTAMCGNDLAYYSSPLIRDSEGNILGTAEGQDMARVWRSRIAEMAARRIHKVPYTTDTSFPVKIQAEDYAQAYDRSPGNIGGAYRQGDVDIAATGDVGGGHLVGWTEAGEWLAYDVVVPANGYYEVSYRVASPNGGGPIQLEKQGGAEVYGVLPVPATGGWQNWRTLKQVVSLKAGAQRLALAIKGGGFDLNWLHLEQVPIGSGNYFIQSQWYTDQFLNLANGNLAANNQGGMAPAAQWYFERVEGTMFYRMRNRAYPAKAIHIENGKLEAGAVGDGWWSSHWELEVTDQAHQFRLKNRWKPSQYINVENGVLSAGPIQPGWVSALWKMSLNKAQ